MHLNWDVVKGRGVCENLIPSFQLLVWRLLCSVKEPGVFVHAQL